jgi:hypothetical protein
VTLTNNDGVVVFAHNAQKDNIRSAAEDVAKKLKDQITKKWRTSRLDAQRPCRARRLKAEAGA